MPCHVHRAKPPIRFSGANSRPRVLIPAARSECEAGVKQDANKPATASKQASDSKPRNGEQLHRVPADKKHPRVAPKNETRCLDSRYPALQMA